MHPLVLSSLKEFCQKVSKGLEAVIHPQQSMKQLFTPNKAWIKEEHLVKLHRDWIARRRFHSNIN